MSYFCDELVIKAEEVYKAAAKKGFHEGDSLDGNPSIARMAQYCSNLHGEVSELWDPFFVQACKDLDKEFPNGRLLPDCSWELGLSKTMVKKIRERND